MTARYFISRPSTLTLMQWTGDNFDEFIAYFQSFGYNQYDITRNEDGTLGYQGILTFNVGDFLTMLGGVGCVPASDVATNFQEVTDTRMTYTVVDDPEES